MTSKFRLALDSEKTQWPAAWYAQGNHRGRVEYLQGIHTLPPRPAASEMFAPPSREYCTIGDVCPAKCTRDDRIGISKFYRKEHQELDCKFLARDRVCKDDQEGNGRYHFSRAFNRVGESDLVSRACAGYFMAKA